MIRAWLGPAAATLALLLAAELGLRCAGFRYARHPVAMRYVMTLAHVGVEQTLYQKRFRIDYILDPVLLWRPLPRPGVTNSEGFVGPEWSSDKPAGSARVMALGDSCTVAGETPYPARLAEELSRRGKSPWQVWNAGVGSWSSYQGRRLLETRLPRFRPDVVTIYFGWNDHWLAWSVPDKDMARHLDRQWRTLKLVEKSRLLQALLRMADAVRGGRRLSKAAPMRVSLQDYEENLRAMVRMVRDSGGEAVLVTAPTTLAPRHPLARALCEQTRNFGDPERLSAVHADYNDVVRRVALEVGAPLADMAAAFSRMKDAEALFTDGIHLTAEGHRRAARLLEPVVRKARRPKD